MNPDAISYVVGLLFDLSGKRVVLIRKRRPEWQKGLLNGPGGKVEANESPRQAMRREFLEETGVDIPERDWEPFGTIEAPRAVVNFYRCFSTEAFETETMTDEKVNLYFAADLLDTELVDGLRVMLRAALEPRLKYITAEWA